MLKSPISKILSDYVARSAAKSENSSTKTEYGPGGRYTTAKTKESGTRFASRGAEVQSASTSKDLKIYLFFGFKLSLELDIRATPPPFLTSLDTWVLT